MLELFFLASYVISAAVVLDAALQFLTLPQG